MTRNTGGYNGLWGVTTRGYKGYRGLLVITRDNSGLHRGCHMGAVLTHKIFLKVEEKFRTFKRPCNFLFVI